MQKPQLLLHQPNNKLQCWDSNTGLNSLTLVLLNNTLTTPQGE